MTEQMVERWYFHDEDTGMEYWHDGEWTLGRCHDGVGLMTYSHCSFRSFMKLCPYADALEQTCHLPRWINPDTNVCEHTDHDTEDV